MKRPTIFLLTVCFWSSSFSVEFLLPSEVGGSEVPNLPGMLRCCAASWLTALMRLIFLCSVP